MSDYERIIIYKKKERGPSPKEGTRVLNTASKRPGQTTEKGAPLSHSPIIAASLVNRGHSLPEAQKLLLLLTGSCT